MSLLFFIGREHELDLLRMLGRHKPNLVIIRGQRRIGKSRLTYECAKDKIFFSFSGILPTNKTIAQDQRDQFAPSPYSV